MLAVPTVTVPPRRPQRRNYWHHRQEAAARIRAARRLQYEHMTRTLLIGYYTGTRPGAILGLHWHPAPAGGWFDLENETLHRKPDGELETRKRQPPARIHRRLMSFLKRWKAADAAKGINCVIHWRGKPIKKLRRSWRSVASEAGATRKDGPHIMRHTAATWLMQAGVDPYEAAGYLGMTVETLMDTYGHHHPSFQENAARASGRRECSGPRMVPETHERECDELGAGCRRTQGSTGQIPIEHLLWEQGVASSNPAAPTNKSNHLARASEWVRGEFCNWFCNLPMRSPTFPFPTSPASAYSRLWRSARPSRPTGR